MPLPLFLLGQVAEVAAELATDAVAARPTLNTGGMIVMAVSVTTVLALISFCLYRVLTLPPVENEADDYHPPRSLSM